MTLSAFSIFNGLAPLQGPKALRFDIDLSAATSLEFDLAKEQDANQLKFVQAIFVDNSATASQLTIEVNGIPFTLKIPPSAMGVFPFIHSGHCRCKFSRAAVAPNLTPVIFLNVPMAYMIWTP